MIREVAIRLEDELKKMGKTELISHISEELINILKRAGIKWSPIYLRRCLDEKYKNPVNRANALARKKYPGLPEDSGRTIDQLEAALQSKQKPSKLTVGELEATLNQQQLKEVARLREENKNLKNQIATNQYALKATEEYEFKPSMSFSMVSEAKNFRISDVDKYDFISLRMVAQYLQEENASLKNQLENQIEKSEPQQQLEDFEVDTDYMFTLTWKTRKDFEKLLSRKVKSEYIYVADKDEYDGRFALEINTPVTIKVDMKERDATVKMCEGLVESLNDEMLNEDVNENDELSYREKQELPKKK
jgi:predicted site-specific integrase-resolvase